MRRFAGKWVGVCVLVGATLVGGATGLRAQVPKQAVPQQLAAGQLEQLKTDALTALKRGEFDRTRELLQQAATGSGDPKLEMMASWVSAFSAQYEKTLAQRKDEFDKTAAQVRLLGEKAKPDYALDATARAYTLALDKRAFRNEAWVDQIVKDRIATAEQYEKSGNWAKASRLYIDLGVIEPANPLWKNKLKLAARYVRIAALYTPAEFKAFQKAKEKEDEDVDDMLKTAGLKIGQATTKPSRRSMELDNVDAQIDWRSILRDIDADAVPGAIRDAARNYWRDVTYRGMAEGGLEAVRTLVTTPGIQTAFPAVGDAAKTREFVAALDNSLLQVRNADATSYAAFRDAFGDLKDANKKTINLPENVLVYEFMDGAFADLDPFSVVIWPEQWEDFKSSTDGEFSGVGIMIERDESGALKVVSPMEDTPAYRAGIKAGDMITHVNGQYVKGILLDQAIKKIKGPTGSKVTLTVRSPDGTVKDYILKRDTIKVTSIKGYQHLPGGGWNWIVDPVQRIGYVRMTSFSKTTTADLTRALEQMQQQGVRGMVLDLRANGGGLLSTATEIADMFLPKGTIVSTRADRETPQAPSVAEADPSAKKYNIPVVVLVNQLSASASEILSGALKDHHRAIIVGERTYGKGSVQMLFPAGRNTMLKLTTSHYYLPSGRCLHREENSTEWGVDPDYTIEMTADQIRAAIDARQEMDVLRGPKDDAGVEAATAKKPVDLLDVDPQLGAAVMLMRLEVAGVKLES